jgi:succinyl-diaminopimelate desuccinylase
MNDIKQLLSELVQQPSISPEDSGCQALMMQYLQKLGFNCTVFDNPPVSNFFAVYGHEGPLLVFAGHTDVVPAGDLNKWRSDPFSLEEESGLLYGRGVADMKGSLACMLVMAKRFIQTHPHFKGRLGFLITSGEEGNDFQLGTPYVMTQLQERGIHIDYCVVGEPSSTDYTGDVIKIGRRGSLSAKITLHGKQGHVAYPHLAENPIHTISPALHELTSMVWDSGNQWFPPTSMQITHFHSGGHAGNIIPGDLTLDLNFRYSTEQSEQSLKEQVADVFARYQLQPHIEWRLNGEPFLTARGTLVDNTCEAVRRQTGKTPQCSTSGGTSDGRFIAPYGVEVIELGPTNQSIHQVNEWVAEKELEQLEAIYFSLCELLFAEK